MAERGPVVSEKSAKMVNLISNTAACRSDSENRTGEVFVKNRGLTRLPANRQPHTAPAALPIGI